MSRSVDDWLASKEDDEWSKMMRKVAAFHHTDMEGVLLAFHIGPGRTFLHHQLDGCTGGTKAPTSRRELRALLQAAIDLFAPCLENQVQTIKLVHWFHSNNIVNPEPWLHTLHMLCMHMNCKAAQPLHSLQGLTRVFSGGHGFNGPKRPSGPR